MLWSALGRDACPRLATVALSMARFGLAHAAPLSASWARRAGEVRVGDARLLLEAGGPRGGEAARGAADRTNFVDSAGVGDGALPKCSDLRGDGGRCLWERDCRCCC